jgi:uncharacterized protein (UPF0335 family)
MGEPVDVPGNQLRAIVERIEQVEDEIKDMNEAKERNLCGSQKQRFRR